MWYRAAKALMRREAGYSKEVADIRDTLTGGINPMDWVELYPQYLEENNPENAGATPIRDVYQTVRGLRDQDRDAFKQWLEDQEGLEKEDEYDTPIYQHMKWEGYARPDWNVHFTDHSDRIVNRGFQYGHPELHGLHLTTWKSERDRRREPGYNFAFPAHSSEAYGEAQDGRYGDGAVLFYGGGADTYHLGDDEHQRIFWGKNVDPRMIFPIRRDWDGKWFVDDATGRVLVKGKDYAEVVDWVKRNYRMLQAIREKQMRRQKTAQ